MINVTLQFSSIADAVAALSRMDAPPPAAVIAPADRPDVGAPEAPASPATAAFGSAVAQAAPLVAPMVPPAATLPSAAVAPPAAPGGVDLDKSGLPWDARIHASTKTKTQAGLWTAKRNTPDDFRAQVEADLRGSPAPGASAPVVPVPPAAPVVPVPPAAPVVPVPPAAPQAKTFAEYMAEIGATFASRPQDAQNHMAAALGAHGLQHVGQLAGRPDLIPAVDVVFRQLLGGLE